MRRFLLGILVLFFLLADLAQAQQPPIAPDQAFLLLSSVETKKLQVQLSEAAAKGYRVLTLLNILGYENLIVLEKQAQPEPVEYLLLGISRVPTAQKELNQGAAQGFRLLPHALVMTGELVGIMEKRPGAEKRYEYRVIDTMRSKSMEREVQQALDQDWQLCWLYRPASQNIAIFERPAGAPAPAGKPPEISDADLRTRLFSPKSFATFNDELRALAGQGHRVLMAPRQANNVSVLVEKMAGGAAQSDYRVIRPKDTKELEESLSKAGTDGFRFLWPILFYATQYGYDMQIFLIAEKAPGTQTRCEYQVLSWPAATQPTGEFAQKLSAALAQGFRALDGVSWENLRALVLEKCGP